MKEVEAKGGIGKISTRYIICVLGSIGLGIAYGLKVNFHVAIVSMVNYTAVALDEPGGDVSHVDAREIQELGMIGGSSVKDATRRILYRLMTNQAGTLFSWEGKNNKFPLKNSKIASAIMGAVRKNFKNACEADIKLYVQLWFVRAKDRLNNNRKAKNQNEIMNVSEEIDDGPFDWSKAVQGILLSAYFWGYMVAELPGGRIAESFSAKWVMFFAIASNVIATILTPMAAKWHYAVVVVMRVIQGLGGGVTFPGMHCMLAHWAPPGERSVMSSIVYAGTALGTVIFMLLTGIIASKIGWEWVFYIEGGASAIWLILWFFLATDSPATQKCISQEERDFIMKSLHQDSGESSGHRESKMPWKAAFTSPAFLAILVAHTCSNWGWYMVLVELPLYMKTVLNFKLEQNSFLTALPFLTMWLFSMIFSKMLDFLRGKNKITTTTARKLATGVASICPLICFVILCFAEGQVLGVVLMTLAITTLGGMFCGFLSNHIDIAPNFAGTLVAITNTVATIPGITVPIVVSALTEKDPSNASWRILFWITIALFAIEFIVFTIFASGEEQEWNNPENQTAGEAQPLKSPTATAKV